MSDTTTKKPAVENNPATGTGTPVQEVFSAKMQDSKILKGMIDAVSAIIDETYFVADANGLNLSAMDESHICMMSATLPAALFDDYMCAYLAKIGINLEDLTKIMKRAGAADAVEFRHAKESEKFQVQMKGQGTRTFSLRLTDIDEEKLPPTAELDVQFDATARLDVGVLAEAVKDAEIYQDTLQIAITKAGAKFSAEGEVGDIEYVLPLDKLEDARVTKDGRGVFALSFLKNILKMSAITDTVTLSIAENAPLKIEFAILNPSKPTQDDKGNPIEVPKGKVTYYLAPRVESEENESYNE